MALTIDELNIKIQSEAESAERGIDGLTDALSRLKANLDFASQLAAVASGITAIAKSSGELNKVDFDNFGKNISLLSKSLQPLQGFKTQASGLLSALRGFSETAQSFSDFTGFSQFEAQVKSLAAALAPLNSVSGKLGATLTALGQVTQISNGLSGTDFTTLSNQVTELTAALSPLGNLQSKLGSTLNNLSRLGAITKDLNTTMATGTLSTDIQHLVSALKHLEGIGKSNLGTVLGQLKKFPEIAQALAGVDMTSFSAGVKAMAEALEPLVTQLNAVSSGFSALPQKVRAVATATDKLKNANNRASKSYGGLLTNITKTIGKMAILWMAFKRVWSAMADWFTESSDYIENLNLFTVTMGDATDAAMEYAKAVQDAMGIDSSDWMKYQGTFQQLATGFGVSSDKAAIMSQNLTQLAYDLSSFFNVDVETAFDKISSGMSGQIKGLKEFGYNLSVAALQEYALSKGITQKVRTMTEAQKSLLRYNLLMEKSTKQQGDMARTLVTPANAVRILTAQLTQLKRAFGNIVSVIAVKVIPYVQAFVQIVTDAANTLATMMGFELPKIDTTGLNNAFADAEEDSGAVSDNLNEIKKQLMGFDELNVLSSEGSSSAGAGGSGSDWDLELASYDFLGNIEAKNLDEIKEKLRDILEKVGLVAVGIGGWKLGGFIADLATANIKVGTLKEALRLMGQKLKFTLGVTLAVTGFTLWGAGIGGAIKDGLGGIDFGKILGGGLFGTGGAAILGSQLATWISTAFAGSAVDLAITQAGINLGVGTAGAAGAALAAGGAGILLGIPTMFVGIYDAIKNGIDWLSGILIPVGGAAAGAGVAVILSAIGTTVAPGLGTIIGLAVGALIDLVILVVQEWEGISAWFSKNVIKPVGNFFKGLWKNVSKFFKNLWRDIVGIWNSAAKWFDTKVVQPIVNFFAPIVDWIGTFFEGCWLIVQAVWVVASDWFNNTVIKPVVGFFQGLRTTVSGFFAQLWEDAQHVWVSASEWFDVNVVQPVVGIFEGLWTSVSGFFVQLWEDIKGVWNFATTWFDTNIIQPVVSAWETAVDSIAGFFEGLWTGIKTGVASAMNAMIGAIESTLNWIIGGINVLVGGFNKVVLWAADVLHQDWGGLSKIQEVKLSRVNMYEFGGFPSIGEMFIARENGPEMVGRMGSRSVVANNDQIVAGITAGVYNAVSAAMHENGDDGSSKSFEFRIPIEVGGRAIGEAFVEWHNGVVKQTGKSPLLV